MSTETTENEDLSISAALGAAIDSIDAGTPAPEVAPVEHEETDPPLDAVLGEPDIAVDTPANPADKPAETQAASVDKIDDFSDPVDTSTAQPDPTQTAPSSWNKDVAGKWADLPPEVRAEVHRRETDYHRGIEQYKQQANFAHEVQTTLQPYMANIQAAGVHPLQAVDKLMQADHVLRNGASEQKAQVLAQIARDYGVDLNQVQPLPPMDPQVQQLMRQNQQLQQFQQSTLQTQQQAVLSEIEAFRANPANAHFEAVRQDMAMLCQMAEARGESITLQEAYDKAVWMRPDIRQTLVHQQSANAQKQQAEAARRQRAQSAAGGVKGSAPSKTTTAQHGDLRSALEAAMDGES